MKQSDTTARFPAIFASQSGDAPVTYPIPSTKPSAGRLSILGGFPIETFTNPDAGGVPPDGADINGMFRTISEAIRASESGQIRPFNANYATQIAGYPKGALVTDAKDPSRLLLSTIDDNTEDPANDTSGAWTSPTDALAAEAKARADADTALTNSLTTEQKERKDSDNALEGSKVNRSGDTMSGPLTVSDQNGNSMQLTAGTLTNAAGKTWQFGSDGSLIAPGGGVLPEVLGIGGRVVIQTFAASGDGSNSSPVITFPHSFKGGTIPTVFTQINAEVDSIAPLLTRVSPLMNTAKNVPYINNATFSFQSALINDYAGPSGQPWTLQILAIGEI